MDAEILRQLKQQIQLDDVDYTGEDALLLDMYERARLMVLNQLGYASERMKAQAWDQLPADLRGVILMTAAHLYGQRESSGPVNVRLDDYCLSVINHYTELRPQ